MSDFGIAPGSALGRPWRCDGAAMGRFRGPGGGADPVTDYGGGKGGPFYGFESGQDPQAKKPVCATNINARVWARRRAKARWRIICMNRYNFI